MSDLPPEEHWDEDKAREIVGATLLIGITQLNSSGDVESQVQMHGKIVSAVRNEGVYVALEGAFEGEEYCVPPDLGNILPADPGEYSLRSTGEVVIDPDYTTTWQINAPNN